VNSPWASPHLAARLTPIAADELAAAALPAAARRSVGYDVAATDVLLGRSLLAVRVAEDQLADLREALAAARAVAGRSTPRDDGRDGVVSASVARWIDAMSPDRIDQLVTDLAARQVVDAAIYAEATRREARDRVWVIVDLLAEAAAQLNRMVEAARGSLAGQHRLSVELPSWQGRFHAAVSQAFSTLDLPPSAKVHALLTVATKELADA
jgi:hypothetical protein